MRRPLQAYERCTRAVFDACCRKVNTQQPECETQISLSFGQEVNARLLLRPPVNRFGFVLSESRNQLRLRDERRC